MKKKVFLIVLTAFAAGLTFSGCGEGPAAEANMTVITSAVHKEAEAPAAEPPAEAAEEAPPVPAEENTSGDTSPEGIVNEIMTSTAMSSMAEITLDRIGNFLDADMSTVESFSMYICGSGAFADEAAVFVMNTEEDTAAMEESLRKRLETKINDYKDYKPEECDKMEDAVIKSKGRYVIFAVSSDNAKAEEIFDSMRN